MLKISDHLLVCINEGRLKIHELYEKWPLASKDDYGLICGFCPLAMPSAASQLISLDLFSSGQRNGFDLASSCCPRLRAKVCGLNCRVQAHDLRCIAQAHHLRYRA